MTWSKLKYLIIMLFIILLIVGCINDNNKNTAKDFSIYLVRDLNSGEAAARDINLLPLESKPFLTEKEIQTYDWKEHFFTIKSGFNLTKRLEGKVSTAGKPFVVAVGGDRIYLGSFWTLLSSLFPPSHPTIDFQTEGIIKDNVIVFKQDTYSIKYYGNKEEDPRDDTRIYNALKALGKIHDE